MRRGTPESRVLDVTHHGAHHHSRHCYPRVRSSLLGGVSDPLSAQMSSEPPMNNTDHAEHDAAKTPLSNAGTAAVGNVFSPIADAPIGGNTGRIARLGFPSTMCRLASGNNPSSQRATVTPSPSSLTIRNNAKRIGIVSTCVRFRRPT